MTTARNSADRHTPVVRSAVVPTAVAAAGCLVGSLLVAGSAGGYGALVGAGCVLGFFGFGQVALQIFRTISPHLFLIIALMTYLLQVVALLAVFGLFQGNPGWQRTVSMTALGLTAMICTMVWMAGLVVAARRERIPLFETEASR